MSVENIEELYKKLSSHSTKEWKDVSMYFKNYFAVSIVKCRKCNKYMRKRSVKEGKITFQCNYCNTSEVVSLFPIILVLSLILVKYYIF